MDLHLNIYDFLIFCRQKIHSDIRPWLYKISTQKGYKKTRNEMLVLVLVTHMLPLYFLLCLTVLGGTTYIPIKVSQYNLNDGSHPRSVHPLQHASKQLLTIRRPFHMTHFFCFPI